MGLGTRRCTCYVRDLGMIACLGIHPCDCYFSRLAMAVRSSGTLSLKTFLNVRLQIPAFQAETPPPQAARLNLAFRAVWEENWRVTIGELPSINKLSFVVRRLDSSRIIVILSVCVLHASSHVPNLRLSSRRRTLFNLSWIHHS